MSSKILISACLAGFNVRYNASNKNLVHTTLEQWQKEHRLVVCCPELAAGFSTPRPPAEIASAAKGAEVIALEARVIDATGEDVTDRYLLGAHLALETARQQGCRFALLSDRSPSCGSQTIYDGSFSGQTQPGSGVTAELLRQHGIEVFSEHQVEALVERVNAAEQG
ncbi:uncharacterized protein YbbK (DUF523 family) [Serratia fonticola]|jgi:uncharacterized protein YbbK (DUF523 family)|uniref:Uncharacterized protein YbbK (DUF523 family) n=1 Tax=Serratia fonticola TaxID=47917 RepID=A0A559SZS9_SERFO|nr:DUF523 domain-containing protein [Serratia fonticola]TQI79644.1 uncharacterized protein YbbK (DUF523 family) [Serratia fonticola]TQI98330.1 uncharacterized protein YbbK (DUF523 family) [Serratia fonticola]TVZ67858.1 uncharacterized protein YbbK (DUF523 family) [Serratia fonticola]